MGADNTQSKTGRQTDTSHSTNWLDLKKKMQWKATYLDSYRQLCVIFSFCYVYVREIRFPQYITVITETKFTVYLTIMKSAYLRKLSVTWLFKCI